MTLLYQNRDGADWQSQAVLAYLSTFSIEDSWDDYKYLANPEVARWENCREQGYVVSLRLKEDQINIAFFEHRNSDNICAVEWNQYTLNSPNIDMAKFGEIYKNKNDVSFSVGFGKVIEMAEWIQSRLELFWKNHKE